MRSTRRSWPTMTRLISKSTRSSLAASVDGGTGAVPAVELPEEVSSGVLAALVTWLPGRAGPALRSGRPPTGRMPVTASVLQDPGEALWLAGRHGVATTRDTR